MGEYPGALVTLWIVKEPPAVDRRGQLSVQKALQFLRKETVQVVIAQSRSHLPLCIMQRTSQITSARCIPVTFTWYFMPLLPPKLKDILEV